MNKRKKPKANRSAAAHQATDTRPETQEILYQAVQKGSLEVVKMLLPHADVKADEGLALLIAFEHGHREILSLLFEQVKDLPIYWDVVLCGMAKLGVCKNVADLADLAKTYGGEVERAYHEAADEFDFLLTIANPAAWNHYALLCAAENGHLDLVMRLLPISNARDGDSGALRMAAQNGHLAVVKALLPESDPKAGESDALTRAACGGHLDVFDLLLPLSDPRAHGSFALAQAALAGQDVIVQRLWAVSDPAAALRTLEGDGEGRSAGAATIRNRLSAERQHAQLAKSTLTPETDRPSQPRL